jgi:DNA helicase-2/ATP-dependent DNA helicase PcrA
MGEAEAERLDNIKELISNTISYFERVPEPSLGGFLEEAALVMDIDNYDSNADAAVLMTIHSAKGLEFPVVFLPGMEEGLFPSQQNLFEPEQLEEERRLAYVAITRAKEKLYILHTASRLLYGRTMYNPVSMFAAEIPEALVDKSVSAIPARPVVSYNHNTMPYKEQKKKLPDQNELQKPYSSTAARPESSEAFKTGDIVVHANFGQGMVLSTKIMGGDMLYEIAFDKAGTKRLMASFAKLKRA